jgi:hypothetical protein
VAVGFDVLPDPLPDPLPEVASGPVPTDGWAPGEPTADALGSYPAEADEPKLGVGCPAAD